MRRINLVMFGSLVNFIVGLVGYAFSAILIALLLSEIWVYRHQVTVANMKWLIESLQKDPGAAILLFNYLMIFIIVFLLPAIISMLNSRKILKGNLVLLLLRRHSRIARALFRGEISDLSENGRWILLGKLSILDFIYFLGVVGAVFGVAKYLMEL